MKKRKHIRKLISLLLIMALMSTCLGVGSVSADDRNIPRKRGLCITGWHNSSQHWFYNDVIEMNHAFNNLFSRDANSVYEWSECCIDDDEDFNRASPSWTTCQPVFDKIHEVFDDSSPYDINYLYLTGHGYNNENTPPCVENCMEIGGYLYYSDLRTELDTIPGHFIVFLQTCYAGQAIGRSGSDSQDADSANLISYEEQIINAFFAGADEEPINRNGELAGTAKYTVFCSARHDDPSLVIPGTNVHTYATYAWAKGLGWQMNLETGVGGTSCLFAADSNSDLIVTAMELNSYTNYYLHDSSQANLSPNQETACFYSKYYFRTIATEDYPLGDASGNGDITNLDVLLIQKHIAGLITLDWRARELADVNMSGTITNTDVVFLQKYIAGVDLY